MGQVYQCWWGICREINVFPPRFEYHIFYVLYQFVIYLLTLPRKSVSSNVCREKLNTLNFLHTSALSDITKPK
jgi:hypothetical protein